MKTINIIFMIFLTLLYGCRYEEGPAISFRKAENRLSGVWDVSSFTINDIDCTAVYNEKCDCDFIFDFARTSRYALLRNCKPDTAEYFGHYTFVDGSHKTAMNISIALVPWNDSVARSLVAPKELYESADWTILKLTNDEMKIQTKFQENDYKIQLQKTEYFTQ